MSSNVKILQPSGNLDGIRGKQLRQEIISAIGSGTDTILLDFQDLAFMDSAGLGMLLSALKTVREKEAKLFLCSINEQVTMLFEMTKMERIFKILTNRDEFNNTVVSKAG
jgi:anti-sigma B factor antagonist